MENYDDDSHVNVGTGKDLTIRQIAELVAKAVGYEGETRWDQTKPDGTPRKVLDISRIESMGWAPKVALEDGIRLAVADFKKRFGA
jgi:GDP-L-fucose synthase